MALPKLPKINQDFLNQLRGLFYPKDSPVVLPNNGFIGFHSNDTPSQNPLFPYRYLYVKGDGHFYYLDYEGNEYRLGDSFSMIQHSHANIPQGGQLDWDNVWSDSVHSHQNAVEGGTISQLYASDGSPLALSADVSGYLSAAVQPLFSAYLSADSLNVTGDATVYTIICDTEITDRNGDYNNATGVFSAPVTGLYLLIAQILASDIGVAHTGGLEYVVTSNRSYYGDYINPAAVAYNGFRTFKEIMIADMDALDTAHMAIRIDNGGKTVDVTGGATYTFFQGYLLI